MDFNSSSQLSSTISSEIQEIAIDLVNTFETRYAVDYENLVDDALLVHNGASAVNSSSSEDTEIDVNVGFSRLFIYLSVAAYENCLFSLAYSRVPTAQTIQV